MLLFKSQIVYERKKLCTQTIEHSKKGFSDTAYKVGWVGVNYAQVFLKRKVSVARRFVYYGSLPRIDSTREKTRKKERK